MIRIRLITIVFSVFVLSRKVDSELNDICVKGNA